MLKVEPIANLISASRGENSLPQNRSTVVEVRKLNKSYGQQLAVKDVSFSFHGGEVLGLLGPNGAGKSTVMMMITGLLVPDSGDVTLDGETFDGRRLEQRRLFGVVPQEYAIYQDLSAMNNLMFFGRLYGLRGKVLRGRCEEVLHQIGLTEHANRQSATYSGGMKRRLNFGIALIHKPQILILDEPTLGVDPQSRFHLIDCINQHTAQGGSVLYASHYMEEAQAICQRVVILDQGRVIANDSIHNLLSGVAADIYLFVDRTTGIGNALNGLARIGIEVEGASVIVVSGNTEIHGETIATQASRMKVAAKPSPAVEFMPDLVPTLGQSGDMNELAWRLQATLATLKDLRIKVHSVETQQSNLERVFLNLTGKQLRD